MKIKVKYVEPAEYIPEDLRKLYKLGEYAEPKQEPKQSGKGAAEQDKRKGSEEQLKT